MARIPRKAIGPMYIGRVIYIRRVIPEHRFLIQMAGLCALVSRHLMTCIAHLSIELWKMCYINDNK